MKRLRRLRRLIADEELLRRRAAGEPLRQIAEDYDVAHTTLGRYFARRGVKEQLKNVRRELRTEQRQLAVRLAAERRLERHLRRKADEQAAAEAERERRYRAALAAWNSRGRASPGDFPAWLDERDAPRRPLTHADLHSTYDKEAAQTVTDGGGIQALLAATELPTLDAAADSIDPEILVRAFDNDAFERVQPRPLGLTLRPRLRRLVPDTQLLRRRAAGESFRMLASDYAVDHATLTRFFARPEIKQQLRQTVQELRAERRPRRAPSVPYRDRADGARRAQRRRAGAASGGSN